MPYNLRCDLPERIVCAAHVVVFVKSISSAPDAECLLEHDARIGPKQYFASDVTSDAGGFDRKARLGKSLVRGLDVADSHRGAKMAMQRCCAAEQFAFEIFWGNFHPCKVLQKSFDGCVDVAEVVISGICRFEFFIIRQECMERSAAAPSATVHGH